MVVSYSVQVQALVDNQRTGTALRRDVRGKRTAWQQKTIGICTKSKHDPSVAEQDKNQPSRPLPSSLDG